MIGSDRAAAHAASGDLAAAQHKIVHLPKGSFCACPLVAPASRWRTLPLIFILFGAQSNGAFPGLRLCWTLNKGATTGATRCRFALDVAQFIGGCFKCR